MEESGQKEDPVHFWRPSDREDHPCPAVWTAGVQLLCGGQFLQDHQAEKIFAGALDANTIITNLTAYTGKAMGPGQTLVFLDEIPSCPGAMTAIKFLVEDGSCGMRTASTGWPMPVWCCPATMSQSRSRL